jgi:hypothetical protein
MSEVGKHPMIGGQVLLQVQLMTKAENVGLSPHKYKPYRTAYDRVRYNEKRLREREGLSTTEDKAGPSNRL